MLVNGAHSQQLNGMVHMLEVSWQLLLSAAGVLAVGLAVAYWWGVRLGGIKTAERYEAQAQEHRRRSRVTLRGRFAEQLAPYFADFAHDPTEARFLGSPIDFVVFEGMAEGDPRAIVFVEVKSGRAQLDRGQRQLRKLIERVGSKQVRFETVRLLQEDIRA